MVYGNHWLDKTVFGLDKTIKLSTGCLGLIKTFIGLDKTAIGGDKMVYGQHNGAIKWSTSGEIVYALPWLHKTSIGLIKRPIAQLALIIDRMAIGFVGLSLKPETPTLNREP